MSYILEALKKLEDKRRRETIPTMLSAQVPSVKVTQKRQVWPYLLFFALLLNAGLFLWWLKPWQHRPAHIAHQPAAQQAQPQPVAIEQNSRPRQNQPLHSSSPSAVSKGSNNIPDSAGQTTTSASDSIQPPPAYTRPKAEQKPVSTYELPLSVKQELPELTISGHFFDSNPASRIVIINGKTLKEGQTVSPGLKLEQITSSGVVFSYQGYRFTRGVF